MPAPTSSPAGRVLLLPAALALVGCVEQEPARPVPEGGASPVSPRSKRIVYSEQDRPSWLPGQIVQVFGTHRFAINGGEARGLAFNGDGTRLACAGVDVTEWDLSGRQLARLKVADYARGVGYSAHGRLLVAFHPLHESSRKEVPPGTPSLYAWRLPGHESVTVPPDLGYECRQVAISPASRLIALYRERYVPRRQDECRVHLVDAETWREVGEWKTPPLHGLVFSPDGKEIALLARDHVILREAVPGGEARTIPVVRGGQICFAYSLNGRRVALSDGHGLSLRDRSLGRIRHLRDAPPPVARMLRLSRGGRHVPSPPSRPGPTGYPPWVEPPGSGHVPGGGDSSHASRMLQQIVAVAVSPDARTAFCAQNYYGSGRADAFAVEAYDAQTRRLRWLRTSVRQIRGLVPSPDGTHLAVWGGSLCRKIDLVPLATGESENPVVNYYGGDTVVLSEDRSLLARSGNNHRTELWDVKAGAKLRDIAHPSPGGPVAFISGGRELVTYTNKTLSVASVEVEGAGTARREVVAGGKGYEHVTAAALSADGRAVLVAVSKLRGRGRIARFRLPGLEPDGAGEVESEVRESGYCPNQPCSVAASPDGKLLAVGTQTARVELWDAETLHRVRVLPCPFRPGSNPTYYVTRVAFSPDGKLLAAPTRDGLVYLWDASTGDEVRRLDVGPSASAVRFDPSGRFLLVGGEGLTAWDVSKPAGPVLSLDLRTRVVSISGPVQDEDGTSVALGCRNGLAYIARLDLP